jgi:hypothetical protein
MIAMSRSLGIGFKGAHSREKETGAPSVLILQSEGDLNFWVAPDLRGRAKDYVRPALAHPLSKEVPHRGHIARYVRSWHIADYFNRLAECLLSVPKRTLFIQPMSTDDPKRTSDLNALFPPLRGSSAQHWDHQPSKGVSGNPGGRPKRDPEVPQTRRGEGTFDGTMRRGHQVLANPLGLVG